MNEIVGMKKVSLLCGYQSCRFEIYWRFGCFEKRFLSRSVIGYFAAEFSEWTGLSKIQILVNFISG